MAVPDSWRGYRDSHAPADSHESFAPERPRPVHLDRNVGEIVRYAKSRARRHRDTPLPWIPFIRITMERFHAVDVIGGSRYSAISPRISMNRKRAADNRGRPSLSLR